MRYNRWARSGTTYYTADEIEFINLLIENGKIAALRGLAQAYKLRRWTGPGMEVNGEKVREYLDNYLNGLPPVKTKEEHWAVREDGDDPN